MAPMNSILIERLIKFSKYNLDRLPSLRLVPSLSLLGSHLLEALSKTLASKHDPHKWECHITQLHNVV